MMIGLGLQPSGERDTGIADCDPLEELVPRREFRGCRCQLLDGSVVTRRRRLLVDVCWR